MKKGILLNLVVLLLTAASAPAATRLVPDEYATIQAAIDAAVDGDVVVLAPITYTGNGNRDIDFHGKYITVRSVNPNDPDTVAATVIDCNGTIEENHRAFYFHSGEDGNSVLCGLTITNGYTGSGGAIYCSSSHPTITNCIIRDSTAKYWGLYDAAAHLENTGRIVNDDGEVHINIPPPLPGWKGYGGGILCSSSSPTLTNCKFIGNWAKERGGGMYNAGSSPTLTNCTFVSNWASFGGAMRNISGSPILINCTFVSNSASRGGAMRNSSSSPSLFNCIFNGNSAGWYGGCIENYGCNPMLTNCTFNKNSSIHDGGVIYNLGSDATLSNCILRGNTAASGNEIFLKNYTDMWGNRTPSTINVDYSDVDGGAAGVYVDAGCTLNWGEGNIDADPCFVSPGYWDPNGVWFEEDYHLLFTSPCIDAGDPDYVPSLGEKDIDGESRVIGGRVDMGVDEFTSTLTTILRVSPTEFQFSSYENGPSPKEQIMSIRNIGSATLNWEITEDCPWLEVYPPNGESTGQVNEVTLNVDISGLTPGSYNCQLTIAAEGAVNSPQVVLVTLNLGGSELYVPSEYDTIQAAIDAAIDWDTVIVAEGTYTGIGNRDIDFHGKKITVRSENGPENCIINCNGTRTDPHRGFYFHSGEDANSILSGFTIANGHARCGGGIYCIGSSPTITNCVFRDNKAKYYEYVYSLPLLEYNSPMVNNENGVRIMCPPPPPQRRGNGAGICCVDSNSTVRNCKFVSNSAYEHGGGMYSMGGSPTLINCTFTENFAGGGGGMANLEGSSPTLTNCVFTANTAETGGGGIRNADNSNPILTNCMFSSNSAGWSGGLGNYYSSPTLTNCTFIGNSADNNGGGINNYESNPVFRNCIFSNNSAKVGGGIFSEHNSSSTLDNCTFSANTANHGGGIYCVSCSPIITNCTFRNNTAEYEYFGPPPPPENSTQMFNDDAGIRIMCPPPPPSSPSPPPPTTAQPRGNGGGIYFSHSSPMLSGCTFSSNSAFEYGGAIYNDSCISSILTDCTFSGNSASSGGGVENHNSSTTFVNCTFTDNSAEYGGGGMRNAFCSADLINCTFNDNSAGWSGGLGNYYCNTTLTNCTFSGNSAETNGGGMNNSESDIVQKSCIFIGNRALRGGGIFSGYNNTSTITNCTISVNTAQYGGGIYCKNAPPPPIPSADNISNGNAAKNADTDTQYYSGVGNIIITNCILWGNEALAGPQIYLVPDIAASVGYSDVQDGWPGEGNVDADPFFVAPGYWDANGMWVEGDYHLLPDSLCINTGDPDYIAEPNETDLDGRPRVVGGRIDMGAYEFNHIPIADAGENQTAYARIDGIAEVTLDGTGSYDDEGQPLTYLWSWTIDGQTYDVNGVTPVIELPVGEQTIELIVNDGIDDSQPDEVVITVIEPVESQLRIAPRVINRHSRQSGILALLRLPQGVTADQIDSNEQLLLYPDGIEAIRKRVTESRRQGTSIFALFDKARLMDAVGDNGEVELQVVGQLKTGQYFYGSDTVRIISPRNND